MIANIINHDSPVPNHIVLNKNSAVAKKMLNTTNLEVWIRAIGYICGNTANPKQVNITFNGADHFVAKYIRPISADTMAKDNFVDGVDFGEKGSYIALKDLVNLYDWRNRYFTDYENYWDYYGAPITFSTDINNAECDLNGIRQKVPTTIVLHQTSTDPHTGTITYKNNGTVVTSDFNIFVKVNVTYGWGSFTTEWITVPVKNTSHAIN